VRKLLPVAVLVIVATITACVAADPVTLAFSNPMDTPRANAICIGPASMLGADVPPGAYVATTTRGHEVPLQVDDLDGDGRADEIVAVLDLPAQGIESLVVDTSAEWTGGDWAEARTSWRYDEYAVLDTDRMGFGLYGTYAPLHFIGGLQWDIYAKRPDAWRLSLDDLETIDYHSDNPVAVDILLVGDTLGLGGPVIGNARPLVSDETTQACRLLCDGPVRAGLEVQVDGWKTADGASYDATIRYCVYSHHDFIDARFTIVPHRAGDEAFGVGIRRIPGPDAFVGDEQTGILGVMGQQEGIIGRTGIGIVFEPQSFLRWDVLTGRDDAYVVRMRPLPQEPTTYRAWLVGVWEYGGIADTNTFVDHLEALAMRMQSPVVCMQ